MDYEETDEGFPGTREEPQLSERQLAAIATTRERAQTLWLEGYEVRPTERRLVFEVVTPEKVDRKTGELLRETYTVDVYDFAGGTCTCPQFAHCGECKHLIAVKRRVEEALALLTPKAPEPILLRPLPPRGSEAYRRQVAADFA